MSEKKYDIRALRKNLAQLRENLREIFGIRRRRLFRPFAEPEEEYNVYEEYIDVRPEYDEYADEKPEAIKASEEFAIKRRTREQSDPEKDIEIPFEFEEKKEPKFRGLGLRDFLRTAFEETAKQIKLRTEMQRLKIEALRKKMEESKEAKRKRHGRSSVHY